MNVKYILAGIILCSLLLATPAAADEWLVPVNYTSNVTAISVNFGTNISGTDGYDVGLDIPAPPDPPGGTKFCYFEITDTYFGDLATDIRPEINASHQVNVWNLTFKSNEFIALTWDTTNITGTNTVSCVLRYGTTMVDMLTTSALNLPSGEYDVNITALYGIPPEPPIANFTNTTARIGLTPLTVSFQDTSTGDAPTGWSWDFGDESPVVTGNATPTHTYTAEGSYNVTLTASNSGGSDTITKYDFVITGYAPTANFTTSNPTTGAIPYNISFLDLSTGTEPLTYLWNFGDSGSSTLQNPYHVYGTVGTFNVSLTVTNLFGSDSRTEYYYITTGIAPTADFYNSTARIGCIPLNVSFVDNSTGTGPFAYSWTFWDGNTSTSRNPYNIYGSVGIYNVSLTVTTPFGSDTLTEPDYVVASTPPAANFTNTTPRIGPTPLTVSFEDTSTGGAVSNWTWDFGDDATSHDTAPSHTYTIPGSYNVSLTVRNFCGEDTITKTDFVVTGYAPAADFYNSTARIGCVPLNVSFADNSTGTEPLTYSWTFGDGNASAVQDPYNSYGDVGTYNVSLTVSNLFGTDILTRPGYVVVSTPPVANFTNTTPRIGITPLNVSFQDTSTGGAVSNRTWTFGDGDTSHDPAPSHTYTTPGNYTVNLTVRNFCGEDTITKTDFVVTGYAPAADFYNTTARTGCIPLSVGFADNSTGTKPLTYYWDFGDGSNSTAANPTHAYTTIGTYNVSLTVANLFGSDTRIKSGYVAASTPPVANFTNTTPRIGPASLTVYFQDTSTGGPASNWTWTFGDGAVSYDETPSHTYALAGAYNVSLTVSNTCGTDTVQNDDFVIVSMNASFIADPTSGFAPLTVRFNDTTRGGATVWNWSFGDGTWENITSADERNVSHMYDHSGIFNATLTAGNGTYSDTAAQEIRVSTAVPSFTASPRSGYDPMEVQFNDTSEGDPVAWEWLFGDGTTSYAQNPGHVYTVPGIYSVTLTIRDDYGTNATVTHEDWITVYSAYYRSAGSGNTYVTPTTTVTSSTTESEGSETGTATATATATATPTVTTATATATTASGDTTPPGGDNTLLYAGILIIIIIIGGVAYYFMKK